jgi:hypothetical protein
VDEFDEFSGYVEIGLGCGCGDTRPVSADCLAMCAPGAPALCDKDWCQCDCHQESQAKTFNTQEVDEETAGHSVGVDDIHNVIHTP